MKLRIVAVGAIKQQAARSLIDDYLGRIRRYCACEEREIKTKQPKKLAAALQRATTGAFVVALDPTGESLTSKQLARRLERYASRGKGAIAFVIGGADGLPQESLAGADARWSLSALTFPHRLARLILAEQLYRALTIMRGEPYDH